MTKLLLDGDLVACSSCKSKKPIQDFHKDQKSLRGCSYYCKECANSKAREWTKNQKLNPKYRLAKQEAHYKTTYGLTVEQRLEMLQGQGNQCAICKTALILGVNTHTDHCHKTNKVRGLLCGNCNRGLGSFKDNTESLMAAIIYLQAHTGNGSQKEGSCP